MTIPKLALFFLGAPRVRHQARPIDFDRHKSLALLAYLALTGQPHRRDALAALLWPDLDQRRARAGLRRVLFSLQDTLPGDWWEVERETVRLQPNAGLWVDVAEFSQLLAVCREHGHPANETCSNCITPLTEAVELYQGDLLAGFSLRGCPTFDDWQFTRAEDLRRNLAGALERLAQWHSGQRQLEPAIGYARRWLALDPLYEQAHQQLMRLYALSNQRSAALSQYADCRQLLESELGVEPQAATRELYQAIKENRLPAPTAAGAINQAAPAIAPAPAITQPPTAEAGPAAPASQPGLLRGAMVGREHEWLQATRLWDQAQAGAGQVLLISGEPGIGKSRFARELAGLAQRTGGRVLTGECYTEGGAPYYPLAQIIRQGLDAGPLGPALPDYLLADLLLLAPHLRARFAPIGQTNPSLETDFERQRLVDSFVSWCQGLTQAAPVLMVVEDIHWADSGTLLLLQNLARRAQQTPLLLVLTLRDSEIERAQANGLDRILTDLQRERQAVGLPLPRLGRAGTGALLSALLSTGAISAEFVDSIFRETEGNPFFIEETCQTLIAEGKLYVAGGVWRRQDLARVVLPRTVRVAILTRVARLPAHVQDTLRLAAVIGRGFDFDVLKAASSQSEEALMTALETAERLQLISAEPQSGSAVFMFAHALIPFALRESLGHPRLRLRHAQVAAALEATRPEDLEALAYHYAAGGQQAKAIAYLRRAGDRAAAVYAYDSAVQHLRQALSLLESEPPNPARQEVMEQIADLEVWRGERPEAMRLFQAALDQPQKLGGWDKWAVVRLQRKMGETLLLMQRPEMLPVEVSVRAGLARALALTENEPPHLETVRLLTTLAKDVYWENYLAQTIVESLAVDTSQTGAEAYLAANVQNIQTVKRTPRQGAQQLARAAIAMAEQLDAPLELSAALEALNMDYANRQMHLESLAIALRRLELSRDPRFRDDRERIGILLGAGDRLARVGRFAQGLPYLLEAEAMAAQMGDVSLQIDALGSEADCYFALDRWDEMLQIEDRRRVLEGVSLRHTSRMCFYCGLTANVLAFRGEFDLARVRRDYSFDHMLELFGPLETWPAIGHY